MKKLHIAVTVVICLIFASSPAFAKMPPKIEKAVRDAYPPAEAHRGLGTAYVPVEPSMMRGYVVVEKGGILAERARYFIGWDDYDYRGVVIHLDNGDGITTRRGAPYTYLKRGDVMGVAGIEYFHNTIYLKLISADIYQPQDRQSEKHFSRVTVMLGFKFPKEVMKNDDADEILKQMNSWLMPFPNLMEAYVYAGKSAPSVEAHDKMTIKKETTTNTPIPATEDAKIKNLEQKIDDAKRQMDEAEKEMKKLRQDRKGN